MSDTNITLVLHNREDLRLEDRPIPDPGYGHVQIQMQRVSICGSDVHFWKTGSCGPHVMEAPLALGHEGSGVVSKLGPGVSTLKVGDRVAIEPATPCRTCKHCKTGRYNLCKDCKGVATPNCDGHIARYFVHAADFCHKLPDNISFEEGALLEPLSVCVHATTRARVKTGDTVLICGAGPIGIMSLLMCKARGAVKVCITDINDTRLSLAKELGADHVINVKDVDPAQVATSVEARLGRKVDVAVECCGNDNGVATAIYATESGGVVMVIGMGTMMRNIPLGDAAWREVDVLGTFRYMNSYPTAIDMLSAGLVNVKPLITHKFNILNAVDAFRTSHAGEGIKIIIDCTRQTQT